MLGKPSDHVVVVLAEHGHLSHALQCQIRRHIAAGEWLVVVQYAPGTNARPIAKRLKRRISRISHLLVVSVGKCPQMALAVWESLVEPDMSATQPNRQESYLSGEAFLQAVAASTVPPTARLGGFLTRPYYELRWAVARLEASSLPSVRVLGELFNRKATSVFHR